MLTPRVGDTLRLGDIFAGFGGSACGATLVPGVELVCAANHWGPAVDTHALNFPQALHICEDITERATMDRFRPVDLLWASPACPAWTTATGERRVFDHANQGVLFDDGEEPGSSDARIRSRALMTEVPHYLDAMAARGHPVLGGVVENVVQARRWDSWHSWLNAIRTAGPGYQVWVFSLNSAHLRPVRAPWAPQSRDRLYVVFLHQQAPRRPDWRKWLAPRAHCPTCDETVDALQVFKDPRVDVGVHGRSNGQYLYRCPRRSCRNRVVAPDVRPAAAAIDWSVPPGPRIGERPARRRDGLPLAPKSLARIEAGLRRHAQTPSRAAGPHQPATLPLNVGADRSALLMSYYGNGTVQPVSRPLGTIPTRDRFALLHPDSTSSEEVYRCRLRMLTLREIAAGMAFPPDYRWLPDIPKGDQARGLGNAVTSNAAEVLVSPLVEAITGARLDRGSPALAGAL